MNEEKERRPVQPGDMLRLRTLLDAQVSPDGKSVAYAVSYIDTQAQQEYADIWLLSLDTGQSRQFTYTRARDWNPKWSPDGQTLAFLSTRGGLPQVYTMSVSGGGAQPLTAMPQGVGGGPAWSPDGRWVAFTAGPAEPPVDVSKPVRATHPIYRFDGLGYLANVLQDIYVIPVAGGQPKQLTKDDYNNTAPVWSPDGTELLYFAGFFPDEPREYSALRVVNLEGQIREIFNEWGYPTSAVWSSDGKRICFLGSPFTRDCDVHHELYVVSSQGGEPECRTSTMPHKVGTGLSSEMPTLLAYRSGILLAGDDKTVYVSAQNRGTIQVFRVSLQGPEEWTPVIAGERVCVALGLTGNRILFACSTVSSPLDLFIAGVDGSAEQQLTHLNADLLQEWALSNVERVTYPTADGTEIEGWIAYPATGQAPYPTIAYVHGGPHYASGFVFSPITEAMVGAGYGVFQLNYRGSTGYGEDFAACLRGNYGRMEHEDLMAGVDHLVERGLADPDQLGIVGASHGGFVTCYVVGQTDRFKAAIGAMVISNWTSFYGTSDEGLWYTPEAMGGLPHEIPEVYQRSSPITYAHRCTTPTLLVMGELDYRCCPEQHEQFYSVLKASGCTTELLRLPGCSHAGVVVGPVPIRQVLDKVILEWLGRFLPAGEANARGD